MLFARGQCFSSVLHRSPLLYSALAAALLVCPGCGGAEPQGEPPPEADLANVQQASISCDQWTDTGYVDGKPFEITLVTVDGKPVEISTANAYVVMQDAAAKDGVSIKVVSGFRTYAEQQYLYNCYVNCNCNNCNLAAKPGYSNHQSGHALDLNTSAGSVLSWLNSHGGTYGFERTVPSEDWHWEWWGGGPGGGPCNNTTPGTPCTVTTTGKSGECMDTSACAALGGHESTPGYCPGPTNIQCCTSTGADPVDAAPEDAAPPPDAEAPQDAQAPQEAGPANDAGKTSDSGSGTQKDAGTSVDAGKAKDAGTVTDSGSSKDARPTTNPAELFSDSDSTGGCSLAARTKETPLRGSLAALLGALLLAGVTRHRVRSARR